MSKKLQLAIQLAAEAHRFQFRKRQRGGVLLPYITHPLEVLKTLWKWETIDELTGCIAVGHDLLEDTNINEYSIIDGFDDRPFGEKVLAGIKELTFKEGDNKDSYLESFAQKSVQSLIIKIADRLCNVCDFHLTDPQYAAKYYKKAQPVFGAFHNRFSEIEKEWGEKAAMNAQEDLIYTEKKFGLR